MHAPPKAQYPTLDDPAVLAGYDAFLLGIPTRYGNFPAQWKVRELTRLAFAILGGECANSRFRK